MCGIAGFVNFTEKTVADINVCGVQKHRGPDAQKEIAFGNVVLTHQRLSIIDLDARSDQPFIKNGLAIIFNGEIYNYVQLKENILAENPDIHFSTTSDTEVLLELYRWKKEDCLSPLIGMFSFAILEIETGKLFIARDHFGIKPLYYTISDNRLAFASELKTLVKIPSFDKTINLTALAGAMNYLWVPGNESIFAHCHKLPAAHYLIIDTKAATPHPELHCYWKLDTDVNHQDEKETLDLLDKYLLESIDRHMVADVPVSSFLSGGLDSSLISVLAAKINPDLSTYTIGTTEEDKKTEQMPEDEKYARLLAKKSGFDHHEIIVNADIVKLLPEMAYTLDEPIGDPAAINTFLICKAAREKGVKVLLSGMGADEIFFGYRRQKASFISLRYKKLPGFLRKLASFSVNLLPVKIAGRGIRFTRWAKRFLSFANLPLEESYMLSYSYYNEKELQKLFTKDIKHNYSLLRKQHATLFNEHYDKDPVNQMCYTDIYMFMQGLNLTYTDRASMAASVEVRVPFIDKELIGLAMKIDGKLKYKDGQSKYILKKVAEKYLPHEIIYRPKASFGAPIRSWISNELKPMVDDLLSKENILKRGFFNYEYIQQMIEKDRKGTEDNAYRIYQLLTLELWCRHFLDK